MTDCIHNINGICEKLSDDTVQQPCIVSPCPMDYAAFNEEVKQNEKR